jgi:PAS domain S-box-containing protein
MSTAYFRLGTWYDRAMQEDTKIRLIRSFSHLTLFVIIIVVGGLAFGYSTGDLPPEWVLAGGLILVILLSIMFWLERFIDRAVTKSLAKANIADDKIFKTLYNNSPVAYVTLDRKGTMIDFNPATVLLLRTEFELLARKSFASIFPPEFDTTTLLAKLTNGVTLTDIEVPIVAADGTLLWALMSANKQEYRDELLVSLLDITDQKRVDSAKSEFVALATHQLRTPIAAIRFNTERLQKKIDDGATEANQRYLGKVYRNTLRMLRLIDDFLSVSKLEMGTFATEIKTIDLTEFFSEIADEYEEKLQTKLITLNRQDNPPHLQLQTDPRLLHIAVSNLMSNAVKYTPANGTVEFTYSLGTEWVTLVVKDNGIGIPAAELEQLFKKFYRATNAQTHQTEGTGLGLYIVKEAIEQLSGTISVSSDTDQGARFEINLPASAVVGTVTEAVVDTATS